MLSVTTDEKLLELKLKSNLKIKKYRCPLFFYQFIISIISLILLFPYIIVFLEMTYSITQVDYHIKYESFFTLIARGVKISFIDIQISLFVIILMTLIYFLLIPILKYSRKKINLEIVNDEKFKLFDFFQPNINSKAYLKFTFLHFINSLIFFSIFLIFDFTQIFREYFFSHYSYEHIRIIYEIAGSIPFLILLSPWKVLLLIFILEISISYFSLSGYIIIDNPELNVIEIIKKNKKISKINKHGYLGNCLGFFKYHIVLLALYSLLITRVLILALFPVTLILIYLSVANTVKFEMFKAYYYDYLKQIDKPAYDNEIIF